MQGRISGGLCAFKHTQVRWSGNWKLTRRHPASHTLHAGICSSLPVWTGYTGVEHGGMEPAVFLHNSGVIIMFGQVLQLLTVLEQTAELPASIYCADGESWSLFTLTEALAIALILPSLVLEAAGQTRGQRQHQRAGGGRRRILGFYLKTRNIFMDMVACNSN